MGISSMKHGRLRRPMDREQKNGGNEPSTRSDSAGGGRPYDSAGLEKVPRPTDDDPPYRPWWVL